MEIVLGESVCVGKKGKKEPLLLSKGHHPCRYASFTSVPSPAASQTGQAVKGSWCMCQ